MEGDTIEVAELFAGVGGFRLGLEGGDFKFVFSNQWEPPGTKAASNLSMAPSSYPLLD
jgi:site-specific DNA-cytosine methylase